MYSVHLVNWYQTPRRTGRINFGGDLQRQPLRKTQGNADQERGAGGEEIMLIRTVLGLNAMKLI